MDTRPLLFLDSGIGGIPYCRHFNQRNPAETIYYLADRFHFPYGTREQAELVGILTTLVEKLTKTVNPKIAVLACNTATVSALAELRQCFTALPFVGTVPAIKPAMQACKTGKVGVLGTARTIEDPYIRNLAGGECEIYGIAAPELVTFVEQRFFLADESEKSEMAKKYIALFRTAGVDTIVLGCTHFIFLLEEFKKEAASAVTSPIKIFDSLDGITQRIESLLDENNNTLRADNKAPPRNRIILTGTEPPDNSWQSLAEQLGFELSLADEL